MTTAADVLAGRAAWAVEQGDARAGLAALPEQSCYLGITSPPYWNLRDYKLGDSGIGREAIHDCLSWARGEPPCGGCWICSLRLVFGGRSRNDGVWRALRDDGLLVVNVGDTYHDKSLCLNPERLALAMQSDGWIVRSVAPWIKRNSMPESARDRAATAHEYIIMASKTGKYFWDGEAIGVVAAFDGRHDTRMKGSDKYADGSFMAGTNEQTVHARGHERWTMRLADGTRGRSYRTSDPYRVELDAAIADLTARLVELRRVRDGDGVDVDEDGMVQALWLATTPSDYDYCGACGSLFAGDERRQVKVRRVKNPKYHPIPGGHGAGAPGSRLDVSNGNPAFLSVTRTCPCGRDDAWTDHYASFGENLVEPWIRAGCPERCCAQCGAGWVRVVAVRYVDAGGRGLTERTLSGNARAAGQAPGPQGMRFGRANKLVTVLHSCPSCSCGCADTVPGIVLDPFAGTGTSVLCAARLGRRGIGLELSEQYCGLARARIAACLTAPLLPVEPVEEQGALL